MARLVSIHPIKKNIHITQQGQDECQLPVGMVFEQTDAKGNYGASDDGGRQEAGGLRGKLFYAADCQRKDGGEHD